MPPQLKLLFVLYLKYTKRLFLFIYRVIKDKKNNGEGQIRKTRKELTNVPRKLEALKTGSESLVETGKRKKEM